MFRSDALKSRQVSWLGDISLARPLSFTFMTAVSACFCLLVVLFFIFGSYTKRSTINGELVPDHGMVKVYSPQQGVLLKRYVSEGQVVRSGDVLFLISSDRQQTSVGDTQATISGLVRSRHASLLEELAKTKSLHGLERATALRK